MSSLNFILAYVENAPRSAALYGKVLGLEPVESSPNFAMFALPNHIMLGLWSRHDVVPAANQPGGVELAFTVDNAAVLNATLAEWKALGLTIIQAPTEMDFGLTFTATDPDGHRLRAFTPSETAVHSQEEMSRQHAAH